MPSLLDSFMPDGEDQGGDSYWVVGLYRSPEERDQDTKHLMGGRITLRDGLQLSMTGVPLGGLTLHQAHALRITIERVQTFLLALGHSQYDLFDAPAWGPAPTPPFKGSEVTDRHCRCLHHLPDHQRANGSPEMPCGRRGCECPDFRAAP